MRHMHDWSKHVLRLSEQGEQTVKPKQIYAKQWAHDVRCAQTGVQHRRVGESKQRAVHDEWLQAGFVAQQQIKTRI